MSLQDVARWVHLGWDTVKSIVKADLARRFEDVPLGGVRRIGVDENYLGKKAKYVTLVVDLDSGRVLWVGKGRGKEALEGFWERLKRSGTKIEAVACDMSGAYWSAINEHLPDAALVFDHFHIIKLANDKIGRLTRMAYGYRDVDFLHLRIYALHESKNILTGT
jgi:transposase